MTSVLTRRTVLKTAALASTALAAPFVRGAYAAGKLSCGFWDHWVPTRDRVRWNSSAGSGRRRKRST